MILSNLFPKIYLIFICTPFSLTTTPVSNSIDVLIGEYADSFLAGKKVRISKKENALYLSLNQGPPEVLILKAPLHYTIKNTNIDIVFAESGTAPAPSFNLLRNGKTVTFKRFKILLEEYRQIAKELRPHGLADAVLMNDLEAVKALIAKGADVMELDTRPQVAGRNGRRPLNWAAFDNRTDIIQVLIDAGADVNATNLSGFTPLHHAAESGSLEAAELLLKQGAKLELKAKNGYSPAEVAAIQDHRALVSLLTVSKKPEKNP